MPVSIDVVTLIQLAVIVPGGAILWYLISRVNSLEKDMKERIKKDDMITYVSLSQQALNTMLNRILQEIDNIKRSLEDTRRDGK